MFRCGQHILPVQIPWIRSQDVPEPDLTTVPDDTAARSMVACVLMRASARGVLPVMIAMHLLFQPLSLARIFGVRRHASDP